MRFFTEQQLGPTQSTTPEGFLLCERVAIARTGDQLYAEGEIPLKGDNAGIVRIVRQDIEVFRPETIASFEGKPVTMDHPSDFVTPDTWNELAVGHLQNVRRGEGIDSDLLVADLLITNADAIAAVRQGLRQVSCGYEAEYVQDSPGVGFQRNIVGNHVALVERGRAGARCAIQDKETQHMTPADKKSLFKRIRAAFRSNDAAALEEIAKGQDAEETEEEKEAREAAEAAAKTGDAVARLQATVDAQAATIAALAAAVAAKSKDSDVNPDDDERKEKTDDEEETEEEKAERAKAGDALRDVASRAELLVPGFSMPTADGVKSLDAVVALQRQIIGDALKTEDGKKAVEPLMVGRDLATMTADAVGVVFLGATEIARAQNNARLASSGKHTKDFSGRPSLHGTIAEMNANARSFWDKRK
jgi:hypothetical protein